MNASILGFSLLAVIGVLLAGATVSQLSRDRRRKRHAERAAERQRIRQREWEEEMRR